MERRPIAERVVSKIYADLFDCKCFIEVCRYLLLTIIIVI